MYKCKKNLAAITIMIGVFMGLSGCNNTNSSAPAETKTKAATSIDNINIATQAVGTSYYAMGTGVAKIITENTPIQATILPYAGPDARMSEFMDGTVGLEVISAMDMYWAYTGTVNYTEPVPDTRLLLSGNWSEHCTLTVLEDSGINKIEDLKGKKVGYEYGGNKLTVNLIDAALATVGMTIDDCVAVPLADLSSAQRALQEHRVDCIFTGATTTPSSVQLNETVGIKTLPIGNLTPEDFEKGIPEEVNKALDKFVPGAEARICKKKGTLKEDTVLTTYPIQMGVSAKLNEDDVYAIIKAIYENYETLAGVHAWGEEWIPENYVQKDFRVPYHDGAVKFYKEVGLWTEEAEACQKALLSN